MAAAVDTVGAGTLPPPTGSPGEPAAVPRDAPPEGPLGRMKDTRSSGLTAPQEKALAAAQKRADSTGRPASVDALTSATDTVAANPGGTVTWTTSVRPQRMRRNGAWTPLDSTLRQNTDGSFAPRAATGRISFSGGGEGDLVTLGQGAKALGLTWPSALPRPTASGSALTYPEVLPGVDLVLTADSWGGFSQVLVVKSARAAAAPGLAALRLGVRATGLKLSRDGSGGLHARSADGRDVFSAPRPVMWDSSASAAPGPTARTGAVAPLRRSDAAGPLPGARSAPIGVRVEAAALTLVPDAGLLRGAGTTYPVYIDPSWNPHPANGAKQHFAGVQEACPSARNYDSTAYGNPGVGLNSWSGCATGRERAYYQIGIPSAIWKTHVVSAVANLQETYSASCSESSTVSLYTSNGINKNTSWSSRPGLVTKLDSHKFGPACSSYASGGFTVLPAISKAAAASAGSWTFALVNDNESSGVYFKRFAPNPSVSITYNNAPAVPASLAATVNAASYGCDTAAPYPVIGKTVATTPPSLSALVADRDKDALSARFTYWADGKPTKLALDSAVVASGQKVQVKLPASYVTSLADGSTVAWQVTVSDGKDTTANSAVCRFVVDQRAPVMPTVRSVNNRFPEHVPGAGAGTEETFEASVAPGSANNTASKFVFGLDVKPPTSNPPASQVRTAVGNKASYPLNPSAPGTHTLWVYALDAAGNSSEMYPYEFVVTGHAPRTFDSLQAAFDNTAVSSDTAPAAADADGAGGSLSLQDLQSAGWKPGEKVTVNGATFTLPSFGSGAPDNVMAANQTIRMNGASGQALVILATATQARTLSDRNPADATSPVVPDGTPVAGSDCTLTNGVPTDCGPTTGAITYEGEPAPAPYYLSVPDWTAGPWPMAVVYLPHVNTPSGQKAQTAKIYAFSIPLKRGAKVASVTLPDLSGKATAGVPGLHVLGMAVRDVESSGTAGSAWRGAWGAPVEGVYNNTPGNVDFQDQTFRILALPSITGPRIRFRLSNVRNLVPLAIDHTTFAPSESALKTSGTPTALTFGGSTSVVIPAGGEVYSDPVVTGNVSKGVVLSFHVPGKIRYLPQHSWVGNSTIIYVTPPGSGDHTADSDDSAFRASGVTYGRFTNVLTGFDVLSDEGVSTVAVLGDSLVDQSGAVTPSLLSTARLPEWLAWRMPQDPATTGNGVVAAGVQNNRLAVDGQPAGGTAALVRLDRDVLSVPGVRTVVVHTGLKDVFSGADDLDVTASYTTLRDQLRAWGLKVVFTTLTPCYGHATCTAAVDANRQNVNSWITEQQDFTTPYVDNVDVEAAVAVPDPAGTDEAPLLRLGAGPAPTDFDSGDHVNLSKNGQIAVLNALPAPVLTPETLPGG
ncbi:hypothetical protein ABT160_03655 [Streptomyces sp. NPDC001941]|uniref:hypothetical protein n=1 Tax=Streptomyces sp. NPDC001941 TaxID=3154659 RepID=UPI003317EF39